MEQNPAPTVHLSPDGRFWWDGAHWQPVRPAASGGTQAFLIVVGVLALFAGLLGLLLVVTLGPAVWEMYKIFR